MTDDRMSDLDDTEVARLAREMFVNFVEAGVYHRALDLTGKTAEAMAVEVRAYFQTESVETEGSFTVKADYQDEILAEARRYREAGDHHFAVIFYAI